MKFKVGDIVKGKYDNGYGITNAEMTKGEVVKIFSDGDMAIRILEHKRKENIGDEHNVDNSSDKFELVCRKKITKQELLDMPVGTKIYTDAEDEEYQVWVKTSEVDFNCNYDDYIDVDNINDDLTLDEDNTDENYGTKIIKIEKPTYETVYDYSTEVQEMTVAEIEKALGHAVKIVKEREDN